MSTASALTYCLNIHPAETYEDIISTLEGPVLGVKTLVSPDQSFPIGMRVSGQALEVLSEPQKRAQLKSVLSGLDMKAISMNGFPYGPFHGTPVKEEVYLPDWRSDIRLDYTTGLIDLMTDISDEKWMSLSTVPGCFKSNAAGAEESMANRFIAAAAHAVKAERETGKTVALAIEPEPCCFLETIDETIRFFETYLYGASAVRQLSELTGESVQASEELLRRHLGVCYDVCHAAVEFEDAAKSLGDLQAAGIPIHKLQLSAALRVPNVDASSRKALVKFEEPTYLHQVVSRNSEGLTRYTDLSEALARKDTADGEEWRVHFHVPIFLDDLGELGTTQAYLAEILAQHRQTPISPHLEVETYTWGVLPDRMRTSTIEEAVARELTWVMDKLA